VVCIMLMQAAQEGIALEQETMSRLPFRASEVESVRTRSNAPQRGPIGAAAPRPLPEQSCDRRQQRGMMGEDGSDTARVVHERREATAPIVAVDLRAAIQDDR
jgi:hypothetical protein